MSSDTPNLLCLPRNGQSRDCHPGRLLGLGAYQLWLKCTHKTDSGCHFSPVTVARKQTSQLPPSALYSHTCYHCVRSNALKTTQIREQFLHLDKPLCRCNNSSQIKSNQIRESPGLVDTSTPGWLSSTSERRQRRKTRKPSVCSLESSLNTLWEWF